MRLQLDPVRVRALRERIGMPLSSAASRSGLSEASIEELELHGGVVEVDVARRLAKAYNRNWYVFLLDNEPGRPSLPRDFRRLGRDQPLSPETLIAFDDAEALIEKIIDLPRNDGSPQVELPSIAGRDADAAAAVVRERLGVSVDEQRAATAEYDAIRFWAKHLSQAGLYVAQLSFPYRDVRAFCLRRDHVSLIVVSTRDSPRARVFSMLHECGHLLLDGEGMCQPESSGIAQTITSEEAFCNAFAAGILMPANLFAVDPAALALAGRHLELGDAIALARGWGVSELAALRRLSTIGLLPDEEYRRLHRERVDDLADEPTPDPNTTKIRKQATRMIYENSRLFAAEVLDAHARGDIALRDVGVLLGGNLKHLPEIRRELGR